MGRRGEQGGGNVGAWDRFLWEVGFAVCHQDPRRTFFFGDRPLFVCARDTGIFVSFFTLLVLFSLLRGRGRGGRTGRAAACLAVGGILFLLGDGFSSYLGWRETTNLLRFLSGMAGGGGLAVLLVPWINRTLFGADPSLPVMCGLRDYLRAFLSLSLAAALYLLRPPFLFRPAQVWLLLSILGSFVVLNLTLVSLSTEAKRGSVTWWKLGAALVLTAGELSLTRALHAHFVTEGWEGFPAPAAAGSWASARVKGVSALI
jgi:uncharacterized membrane protein